MFFYRNRLRQPFKTERTRKKGRRQNASNTAKNARCKAGGRNVSVLTAPRRLARDILGGVVPRVMAVPVFVMGAVAHFFGATRESRHRASVLSTSRALRDSIGTGRGNDNQRSTDSGMKEI